ncbi:hypothetical protein O206_04125 [Ochrobactrum sp. EGD-AQ16]|nr:hypothetical protein O206_04125 [Ochrobactrum sp. EGD-AQ16]
MRYSFRRAQSCQAAFLSQPLFSMYTACLIVRLHADYPLTM